MTLWLIEYWILNIEFDIIYGMHCTHTHTRNDSCSYHLTPLFCCIHRKMIDLIPKIWEKKLTEDFLTSFYAVYCLWYKMMKYARYALLEMMLRIEFSKVRKKNITQCSYVMNKITTTKNNMSTVKKLWKCVKKKKIYWLKLETADWFS